MTTLSPLMSRCTHRLCALWSRIAATSIAAALLFAVPAECQAANNSNRVDIALQASVLPSITLAAVSPAVAFGVVTPGAVNGAPAGQTITIVTAWTLAAGQTVTLYAYFDSASSAMAGAAFGDTIPSSAFTGSVNGGSSLTFTQTNPFNSASTAVRVYAVPVTAANAVLASRSDTLALAMNLSGISLHPDAYTGVLHLQAQAL